MRGVDFFEHYVELVSHDGWYKRLTDLDQDLYIGTLRYNQGGGVEVDPDDEVEPRHLLLRPSPSNPFCCVLYNLSQRPVAYLPGGLEQDIRPIEPNKSQELYDGDRVNFGSYRLIYHGDRQPGPLRLKIRWRNGNQLVVGQHLEGEIFIHAIDTALQLTNAATGNSQIVQSHQGLQFTIALESPQLPKQFFHDLNPSAMIYPNSREGVVKRFQLHHPCGSYRKSGAQPFTFRVTANNPTLQQARITRQVYVAPYFKHQIKLTAGPNPTTYHLSAPSKSSRAMLLWHRLRQRLARSNQTQS